jgi:flagellar protein FliO/FliZ
MRGITTILFSFFTTLTYAAQEKNIPSLTNEPVGVSNYIQMFFGLFLVVGLIFGMAWFMRRMGNMQGMAAGNLKVLGGISIGQRERVVLIQAGEQQILIGVAPGTIRTLHVLDEPIVLNTPTSSTGASGFAEKLHAAIKNRGQS